jgi:hypothetical protein
MENMISRQMFNLVQIKQKQKTHDKMLPTVRPKLGSEPWTRHTHQENAFPNTISEVSQSLLMPFANGKRHLDT